VALERAQLEWRRVEDLLKTNAVSREEYDQRRTAVATAEAQVKWAQAAVDLAKLNLEYCRIRSPIDGRTGQRLVDPGNIVKANEGSLVSIQRLDPIYADFTVTERELQDVRRGMSQDRSGLTVHVALPAPRNQDAATQPSTAPATPREGKLTFLDNAVQDATGTVKLRATVPNSDRYFWPGQFVNVRLVLAIKRDAPLVPTLAVQTGQQGRFVLVVTPDRTAEMRPVVEGQKQGDLVVIDSGVAPGEQVIVAGHMGVMPGAKVMVTNAPQQQTAAK
jgi:multidrug efflux system membrane fusion protein